MWVAPPNLRARRPFTAAAFQALGAPAHAPARHPAVRVILPLLWLDGAQGADAAEWARLHGFAGPGWALRADPVARPWVLARTKCVAWARLVLLRLTCEPVRRRRAYAWYVYTVERLLALWADVWPAEDGENLFACASPSWVFWDAAWYEGPTALRRRAQMCVCRLTRTPACALCARTRRIAHAVADGAAWVVADLARAAPAWPPALQPAVVPVRRTRARLTLQSAYRCLEGLDGWYFYANREAQCRAWLERIAAHLRSADVTLGQWHRRTDAWTSHVRRHSDRSNWPCAVAEWHGALLLRVRPRAPAVLQCADCARPTLELPWADHDQALRARLHPWWPSVAQRARDPEEAAPRVGRVSRDALIMQLGAAAMAEAPVAPPRLYVGPCCGARALIVGADLDPAPVNADLWVELGCAHAPRFTQSHRDATPAPGTAVVWECVRVRHVDFTRRHALAPRLVFEYEGAADLVERVLAPACEQRGVDVRQRAVVRAGPVCRWVLSVAMGVVDCRRMTLVCMRAAPDVRFADLYGLRAARDQDVWRVPHPGSVRPAEFDGIRWADVQFTACGNARFGDSQRAVAPGTLCAPVTWRYAADGALCATELTLIPTRRETFQRVTWLPGDPVHAPKRARRRMRDR